MFYTCLHTTASLRWARRFTACRNPQGQVLGAATARYDCQAKVGARVSEVHVNIVLFGAILRNRFKNSGAVPGADTKAVWSAHSVQV
jgi:hypothetical protein